MKAGRVEVSTANRTVGLSPLTLLGGAAAAIALAGLAHAFGRADFTELSAETLAVKLHLTAAVGAVGIGAALMGGRKGRTLHKRLGWTWVVCMAVVAVSSFFIRRSGSGDLSWIHVLSGWTLIGLPMGVAAIKRRNVQGHRRTMMGLFYGGLLTAGAFAFVPGRLLFRTFFG